MVWGFWARKYCGNKGNNMTKNTVWFYGTIASLIMVVVLQYMKINSLEFKLTNNGRKYTNLKFVIDPNEMKYLLDNSSSDQIIMVQQTVGDLNEPIGDDDDKNILDRIKMLRHHLMYNPSREWFDSVLSDAYDRIESYDKSH